MKSKLHVIAWSCLAASMLLVTVFDLRRVDAQAPPQPSGLVDRLTIGSTIHPSGPFVPYQDFAAYAWSTGVPWRVDTSARRQPILVEYSTGFYILWYWDGYFRSSNGSPWGTPKRWAYLRLAPERWDGNQFVLPDGTPSPVQTPVATNVPKSLQYLVDGLKIKYSTIQIMNAMDASPFDEPEEGAPLE